MIEQPPLPRIARAENRNRPAVPQIAAFRAVPTGFVTDAMDGAGAMEPDMMVADLDGVVVVRLAPIDAVIARLAGIRGLETELDALGLVCPQAIRDLLAGDAVFQAPGTDLGRRRLPCPFPGAVEGAEDLVHPGVRDRIFRARQRRDQPALLVLEDMVDRDRQPGLA